MVAPVTSEPLTFHWYVGVVPPFVGVAVNVILVPIHIAPLGDAEILTLAGKDGLTIIVTPFEVTGEPVKHGVALLVITTLTTSLFAKEVVV